MFSKCHSIGLKQIYPNYDLVHLLAINTLNKVSTSYFQIVRLAFSIFCVNDLQRTFNDFDKFANMTTWTIGGSQSTPAQCIPYGFKFAELCF